jgi:hypothetical protein
MIAELDDIVSIVLVGVFFTDKFRKSVEKIAMIANGGEQFREILSPILMMLRVEVDACRMLAQFFDRHLDHPATAPDIDRQTLASVRGNDLLDGCFERHLGTLFQRQFKNVCWRLSHVSP